MARPDAMHLFDPRTGENLTLPAEAEVTVLVGDLSAVRARNSVESNGSG